MYDCNLCDEQPVFANEREWSLHNAMLHYKPATSFGGRQGFIRRARVAGARARGALR